MNGNSLSLRTCVLASAVLAAACGDDATDGMDAGHGDHTHGDAGGFTAVPCGDVQELNADAIAVGEQGRYQVKVLATEPYTPPRKYASDWLVEIQDTDGQVASDAEVLEVIPFMPAHNHGGIRVPVISEADGPGRFQVDDVNLWMGGPWTVTFELEGPEGADEAVFDVCIKD